MTGVTNGVLAQFARTTETSLELDEQMTRADWVELGEILRKIKAGVDWWLGDWWRFGQRKYGDAAEQAAPTGYAVKTLQNAAWVAGSIEPSRRREDLEIGHHAVVAGIADPTEQDEWLDKAAGADWSVHELRAHVKKAQNGGDSVSDTMKLLRRAVEQFERDNPNEGRGDFLELAEKAWADVHGLATPVTSAG